MFCCLPIPIQQLAQHRRWLKPISQTAFAAAFAAAASRSMIVNPSNGFVVDVQPVCHFLHRWSITIFLQELFLRQGKKTKYDLIQKKIFSSIFLPFFLSPSFVRWPQVQIVATTQALLNLI